jgi:hypothetical protein
MITAKVHISVRLPAVAITVLEAIQAKYVALGIEISQGQAMDVALKAWAAANGEGSSAAAVTVKPAKKRVKA